MKIRRLIYISILLSLSLTGIAQETKSVQIKGAGGFERNEEKFPNMDILKSRGPIRVHLYHEGVDIWSDRALFNKKENFFKAWGNIILKQGDTITMNSGYIEYNGDSKLAVSREDVRLTTPEQHLTTDTLYFDRNIQQAYYNTKGIVKDSSTTLTSDRGRYYLDYKKYQFLSDVVVVNPEYTLNSVQLDYYTNSKHAYMYGPSTIVGNEYDIYCERGFYDTAAENGFFVKNSKINYNNREIKGDSLYFDNAIDFASATNNIKLTDTINKSIIRGHYAEIYKAKDSAFITSRAVAINLIEKDSMYIHGDRLMVTGPEDNRIIRGFKNVKFYKTDLSGKCDSIHINQKTGLTQLIRRPIMWSDENQMTGDTIHLISNPKTEQLDSLKVINNSFVIQKDSLSSDGYNQIKGVNLYGKFEENELKTIDIVKNTEAIYYLYSDKDNEFIGIEKIISSIMNMVMGPDGIEELTAITKPDGDTFPDVEIPKNARKLRGFVWYGDERINSWEEIFDEDDNNLVLPKIYGVDQKFDFESDPSEEEKKGSEKFKQDNKALLKKKKTKRTPKKAIKKNSKKAASKLKQQHQ